MCYDPVFAGIGKLLSLICSARQYKSRVYKIHTNLDL